MQLISGWLDIAKRAQSSWAKNTRENLGLYITLGFSHLFQQGADFSQKKNPHGKATLS